MTEIDTILEQLRQHPPDFEEQYGAGTSGEKIAQNTWLMAINSVDARLHEPKKEVVHPLRADAEGVEYE